MVWRGLPLVLCVGGLCACTPLTEKLAYQSDLTPVGSGLSDPQSVSSVSQAVKQPGSGQHSWIGGPADYFRDNRARTVGDLLTVRVSLNDNANFNSTTDGKASSTYAGSSVFNLGLLGLNNQGQTSANTSLDSAASGQGSVTRSEKLNVQVSAMVRQVLPNGLLLVEGSQEILVNAEKRVVKLSGIVDPRFVDSENTIDYSKIAEARISYGGTGEMSARQKPKWGVQLWDKINPF